MALCYLVSTLAWTVNEFFISSGRTDVLAKSCYEAKKGLGHLLRS